MTESQKENKYTLNDEIVLIQARDWSGNDAQQMRTAAEKSEPCYISMVGFVISNNEENLVLAMEIFSEEDHELPQVRRTMCIPIDNIDHYAVLYDPKSEDGKDVKRN